LSARVPALMVVLIGKYLREPQSWLKLKEEGRLPQGSILAPYRNLVVSTRWRRNLIVGALIASTGVIGLWAIGEICGRSAAARVQGSLREGEPAQSAGAQDWNDAW